MVVWFPSYFIPGPIASSDDAEGDSDESGVAPSLARRADQKSFMIPPLRVGLITRRDRDCMFSWERCD